MKQSILMALVGLSAGLVLAGNFAEGQAPSEPPEAIWPPSVASDIVNQTGIAEFRRQGDSEVIYTVPEDRWLVVTDFRTVKRLRELFPEPNLNWRNPGAKQGTLVIPWQLSVPAFNSSTGSAVGLKFPPGSEVVLERDAGGTARLSCFYFIAGYLTK
jgi:hypothetical protein